MRNSLLWTREKSFLVLLILWMISTCVVLFRVDNSNNDSLSVSVTKYMYKPQVVQPVQPRVKVTKSAGSELNHDLLASSWQQIVSDLKLIRPPDSVFNINITRSEEIPLSRVIPDTRPTVCRDDIYNIENFPKTSIIIPVYNEGLSLLLRTVHSILDRTPESLLEEIILVDDCSPHADLGEALEKYVKLLGDKVILVRNFERQGLIRSRLHGMQMSRAPIVVFLDAHVEVNVQWLEPILAHLLKNPESIVQPFVDGIDPSTLVYSGPTALYRGGLTWDLRYVWVRLPEHIQKAAGERGLPFWTPTLIGCAMAVNKTFFKSIGSFDADQMIWGGENVEVSLRTWMCGGSLTTLPCSRIGHVFRPTPYKKESPFQVTWQKNRVRTAEVWLGPYKKYFYAATESLIGKQGSKLDENEQQSLEKRKRLREELKCKSFDWYLSEISQDLRPPPRNALFHGEITNRRTDACWKVLEDGYVVMDYMCWGHRVIVENIFTLSKDGLLMYGDKCVIYEFPRPNLRVQECPTNISAKHYGVWYMEYSDSPQFGLLKNDLQINGAVKTQCIAQVTSVVPPHNATQMPQIVQTCDSSNRFQLWSFTYRFDSLNL